MPARKRPRDLGDELVRHLESKEPLRKRLVAAAKPSEVGDAIAALLVGGDSIRTLRALLPQLKGVTDKQLSAVRGLVTMIARAVEDGDRESIAAFAGLVPVVQGIDGKNKRRLAIHAVVQAWINELPHALARHEWAKDAFPLPTLMDLAACGMPVSKAIEATFVPDAVRRTTKAGYGHWGPAETSARLMAACKYPDKVSAATLKELLKAEKKNAAKKS